MLAILCSVTNLVPINNRIKSNPPPDGRSTGIDGICFTVGVL
jgi:hypothetical protein